MSRKLILSSSSFSCRRVARVAVIGLLISLGARTQAAPAVDRYNFSFGAVKVSAFGETGLMYNDNINLSQDQEKSDVIWNVGGGLKGAWQATELNTLSFKLIAGYDKYFHYGANDSIYISPETAIGFDIYVDDFRINLHDRFSYQTNPIDLGTLSNVSKFSRFENTAGVTVDWDLGDIIPSASYDRYNFWARESGFKYLDRSADVYSGKITFIVDKTAKAGVEGSLTQTGYDENFQNGSVRYQLGLFVEKELSETFAVNARGGLDSGNFDRGGGNFDTSDLNSYYLTGGFYHRLTKHISHFLTAGLDNDYGLTANTTRRTFARHNVSWQAADKLTIGTELFYEKYRDSQAALIHETSWRRGAGMTASYLLVNRGTLSLAYHYVDKESDLANRDYTQDTVSLTFRYQF